MALTIEQLYQQYAGRAPDPEGLAYWTKDFGSTVDPREVEVFKAAVAEARAQGTEPAAPTPAPVSNQAVASWLQANPSANDATIAAAMQQYGVTPAQMAAVTGIPENQIAARVAAVTGAAPINFVNPLNNLGAVNNTALATGLSGGNTSIPGVTNTLENLTSQIQRINTALDNKNWTGSWRGDNNAAVNAAAEILSSKGVSDLSNLTVVPTQMQQYAETEDGGVVTTVPGFNLVDKNTGQVISTSQTKDFILDTYDTGNIFKSNDKSFGITVTDAGVPVPYRTTEKGGIGKTALAIGATMFGAPYLSGLLASAAPATFAAGTAANAAATGAILGGGSAAITGNDILKGALLGGLGGYASNALAGAMTPTDLGMNSNLTMAQIESGLGTPGYGYGAQAAASGLFNPAMIGAGAYQDFPASSLAPDNIDIGGGWSPNLPDYEMTITASRPEPVFDFDGLPVASYSNEGRNYFNPESTQGAGGSPVNSSVVSGAGAGTSLTPSQISNLVKAGIGLVGTNAVGGMLTGTGGGGVGALPTQNVPQYSPGYYNAIQQYYNSYMPEMPRDVATPLQQWYESKYGA